MKNQYIPRAPKPYAVYILHFSEPLHHARHYCGFARDLQERIHQHRAGKGAKLTRAVVAAGITLEVVRIWYLDDYYEARDLEREIKRDNHGPRYCPICSGKPRDANADLFNGRLPPARSLRPRRPMYKRG